MGVSENLKRGVTELVLLGLLAQRDMYGYEMSQELQTRSGGKFILQESSMYPTLYRLGGQGLYHCDQTAGGQAAHPDVLPSGTVRPGLFLQSSVAEYLAMQEGIRAILTSCGMNEVEPV